MSVARLVSEGNTEVEASHRYDDAHVQNSAGIESNAFPFPQFSNKFRHWGCNFLMFNVHFQD